MEVKQNVNIHNRFDIEVRDINTGKLKQKETAYNIILDQMWTRLCGGSSYFSNIHFGTGSGTPSASRTSLFSHLGTKTAVDEEIIKAVPLSAWKRKIVLNPEEYVGSIITEVGIAFGSTASNLVTHAMLKDSEGNQISIAKTSTDVITIYATVFVTLSSAYENLNYLGLPSSNALINYLVGSGSAPTGTFGLSELINSYARLGSTSTATWVSDTANKKRKTNVLRFGIAVGNGNVKALDFTNLFALNLPQIGVFTGQSYTNISVGVGNGVTKKWKMPSANIKESSINVMADGVTVSNISLETEYYLPVKLTNPAEFPTGTGNGIAITPDGSVLAVAHNNSPYVTTYDWIGGNWVKRPNPDVLPSSSASGVALSSDGLIMAVAHSSSLFISTYDWNGGAWVKRPNPSVLPPYNGRGIAITPDGSVLAVAHEQSPYITTYDWNGGAWVKRPNPSVLPIYMGNACSLSQDGSVLAVGHGSVQPFIITYDWNGGAWVKRPNPSVLPSSLVKSCALTPDGLTLVIAHYDSPYVTTYDWIGNVWVKRPNPSVLPPSNANGIAITPDGSVLAVSHDNSPYVTIYDWIGGNWVKRPNPDVLLSSGNGLAFTQDGEIMVSANSSTPFVSIYKNIPFTYVTLDTPPATGQVITADYTVDGIHKTDQYVIDVSCAIQFGEGV